MSQDPPHDPPTEQPAPSPAEDPNAPIPLEPREDTPPSRKPRIDSPGLLEDFDEDADFDSDPELERVVKGIPVGGPSQRPTAKVAADAAPKADPISAAESWRLPAALGAVITLTAAVFAGVYADNTLWAHVLITIYWAALHTATGVGAIVVAALLLGRPVGHFEGAAARMLLVVSMFLVVFSLEIPISTTPIEETIFAAAAYFGGLIVAFRLTPRDAGVVAGAHFGLALLIAFGSMLSAAISSGAGAAAGAAG